MKNCQCLASIRNVARVVKVALKLVAICLALSVDFGSPGSMNGFAFSGSHHLHHVSGKVFVARISQTGTAQGGLTVLRPGEVIGREIKGGDVNAFSVHLTSGQYVRVVVERQKIDLFMSVFNPEGKRLIESANPGGARGPVSVSIMAETTGDYKLEVRPSDKWSAAGSYKLSVGDARVPSAADLNRLAAEKAFAEARQQQLKETDDSRHAAILKYEQALQLWKSVEDGYEEANTLHSLGKVYRALKDLPNAEKYYQLAVARRREIKDLDGEAYTLNDLAAAYRDLSDWQKSLEFYERSVGIFRQTGNRPGEASSLYGIGYANALGTNMPRALDFYGQALVIRRAEKDRHEEARILNAIGGAYDILGDPAAANESYGLALEGWHETGDTISEANTISNLGKILDDEGEWQKALENYNKALTIYGDLPNPDDNIRGKQAATLGNLGLLYAAMGDSQRALAQLNKSLAIRQELKQPRGEGFAEACLGYVYFLLDDAKEALSHYEKALPLQLKANDPRIAQTYTVMGMVYAARGESQRARNYYQQALRIQQDPKSGNRQGQAITLDKMGQVYAQTSDLKNALDVYEQALRLWRGIKDRDGEAITLYNLAQVRRKRGELSEAHQQIEAALKIVESMRTNVTSQQLRTTYFANKENYYELDIDLKMQLGKSGRAEEYTAAALEANERARARSLLDLLSEARIGVHENGDETQRKFDPKLAELVNRKLALQRKLNAKANAQVNLLGGKHSEEQAATLAKEIDALTDECDEIETQIKTRDPRYATLTRPQLLRASEIERLLDDETMLLEYSLGAERSYLWVVTQTGVSSYELPKRALIEEVAARVKDVLASCRKQKDELNGPYQARLAKADADYWREASALSQMLLGRVAAQLGKKRLIIVAEGELQYVPFGGLPLPALRGASEGQSATVAKNSTDAPTPLIVEHEIVNLPSASTLALIRSEAQHRQPASKAVAVIADPVFEKDDSRLPRAMRAKALDGPRTPRSEALSHALRDFDLLNEQLKLPRLGNSSQEARDIMAAVPAGAGFEAVGFKASRATATDPALAQYRFIHFATHGLVDEKHPELSGIVLSLFDSQGRPQENGFLRLHDIYNLRLPVEMVVLSACQTGLGKRVRGEGLVGLTRGFMYAGATRVVASLWKVDDEATALLMRRFYHRMLKEGMSPASALRGAQVEMWQQNRWRSPYYWSGFVLQGEWRNIDRR
jgi:CHAT domain-containing protein/Tfp pilus assembly protein PilF